MQTIIIIFTLFFSLVLNQGKNVLAQTETKDTIGNVTIFIYHKFGESEYPTTNVSVDRFAEQLRYLKENDFKVLSLKSVVGFLETGSSLPEKSAVITIDDGYTSIYTEAWPLLQEYDYPFTVFLYVKATEKKYRNYLTWEQVREMQNRGVDFQDHGYSHHRFGDIPEGMDDKEYTDWILGDLKKGKQILEDRLGYSPQYLALPYGEYNTFTHEVAQKLGYKAVFTQDPGSVSRYTDIFAIPREPILGDDWATMAHFAKVLTRKDLPVTDIHPSIEPMVDLQPKTFCATILKPHLYKEESFEIYVSELGWEKAQLVDKRLCIKNDATLQRRSSRVAIQAREIVSGDTAIHYWLVMRKNNLPQYP